MCAHACCVPFLFLEHEALGIASRLFAPNIHLSVIPIMLLCERAQRAEPVYRYTATAVQQQFVRVCMLSLNREHSKSQHSSSAITPAQSSKQPSTCRSEYVYQNKYVRTCMLRPVCFPGAWSSWHLQVTCLHLKCWTIYLLHISVILIHSSLRASVTGGTARYTKRLVHTYAYTRTHRSVMWSISSRLQRRSDNPQELQYTHKNILQGIEYYLGFL